MVFIVCFLRIQGSKSARYIVLRTTLDVIARLLNLAVSAQAGPQRISSRLVGVEKLPAVDSIIAARGNVAIGHAGNNLVTRIDAAAIQGNTADRNAVGSRNRLDRDVVIKGKLDGIGAVGISLTDGNIASVV